MQDLYGRIIDYLRISVTDLCNFRCRYCMPAEGVTRRQHAEILSFEELTEIAQAAAVCGIRKIRLTGGEPLVRRGIVSLCGQLAEIPGIHELTMTTNGALLRTHAKTLKGAGLSRVNLSLDTLQPEKFRRITRGGSLTDVLDGIDAALEAGLTPLKLNTVLIHGFNDDEIRALAGLTRRMPVTVRFIELMPVGCAKTAFPEGSLAASEVLQSLPELMPAGSDGGVASLYKLPDACGQIGLIRPLSCSFCASCNRIRLTSDGKLKPCLHSRSEYPLRGLHGTELEQMIRTAVLEKPERHHMTETGASRSGRYMNEIGG